VNYHQGGGGFLNAERVEWDHVRTVRDEISDAVEVGKRRFGHSLLAKNCGH